MFFTKNDFDKIAEYLKSHAKKDTDFVKKESVSVDSDILTIVSNGVNYKIHISDLLKSGIPLITIDKLKAVSVETSDIKVTESITVDANNIHLNNDKGTTLLDILNYFENNKLDRHNSDTFKGDNLTIEHKLDVKEELNIQSGRLNIKEVPVSVKTTSTGNNLVIDSDLTILGDIKDGKNNILNDTTLAAKGWKIELGTPSSPSVRESYYLKDYKGNSHGLINIYKDSAILDIKVGYENANYETPEGQKPYINPGTHEESNDDRLCILYSLSDGTLDLVKINLSAFLTEAEVDLNRGLGVDASTRKIYLKLADDDVTKAYISFNENTGALSAAGIEDRILLDLGTITDSLAGDGTMWGTYKKHEGTLEDSLSNDNSRWGKFKEAEEVRNLLVSDEINRIQTKVDEVNLETIKEAQDAAIQVIADREIEILSKTDATLISTNTEGLKSNNVQANLNELVSAINDNDNRIASLHEETDRFKSKTNTKLIELDKKNDISLVPYGLGKPVIYSVGNVEDNILEFANNLILSVEYKDDSIYKGEEIRLRQILVRNNSSSLKRLQLQFFAIVNGSIQLLEGEFLVSNQMDRDNDIIERTGTNLKIKFSYNAINSLDVAEGTTILLNEDITNPYAVYGSSVKYSIANIEASLNNSVKHINLNIDTINKSIDTLNDDVVSSYGTKDVIYSVGATDMSIIYFANNLIKKVVFNDSSAYKGSDVRLRQILVRNNDGSFKRLLLQFFAIINGSVQLIESEMLIANSMDRDGDIIRRIGSNLIVDFSFNAINSLTQAANTTILYNEDITNPYAVYIGSTVKLIGKEKVDVNVNGFLFNKKIVTLCDSLGATSQWQKTLAEISGAKYEEIYNDGRYSYGGTPTLSESAYCGQDRAKFVVNDGLRPDVILIENVNDGNSSNYGSINDEPFFKSQFITINAQNVTTIQEAESYWTNNFSVIVSGVTQKIGTIIGIKYTNNYGLRLDITHGATTKGTFQILVTGTGYDEFRNIELEGNETPQQIVDAILNYNWNNYIVEQIEGTTAILFSTQNNRTEVFNIKTNGTGVSYSVTNQEGYSLVKKYFAGYDISKWNFIDSWINNISHYSAWKGIVQYLQENLPSCQIFWLIPKTYSFNYNSDEFKRADGSIDYDKILTQKTYGKVLFQKQIEFCEYYEIPYIDLRRDSGINPANLSEYMNVDNVHPKQAAYDRWAVTINRLLNW